MTEKIVTNEKVKVKRITSPAEGQGRSPTIAIIIEGDVIEDNVTDPYMIVSGKSRVISGHPQGKITRVQLKRLGKVTTTETKEREIAIGNKRTTDDPDEI